MAVGGTDRGTGGGNDGHSPKPTAEKCLLHPHAAGGVSGPRCLTSPPLPFYALHLISASRYKGATFEQKHPPHAAVGTGAAAEVITSPNDPGPGEQLGPAGSSSS